MSTGYRLNIFFGREKVNKCLRIFIIHIILSDVFFRLTMMVDGWLAG